MEERRLTNGNSIRRDRTRAQDRTLLQQALERVCQVAKRDKEEKLTTLWHHVYDVRRLREAYFGLNRQAASGVDRQTWQGYGENLEENLQDLSARLQRGAYRAKPVRRGYVPKQDGSQRPIGVPTLEDRIVQRSAAAVIGAVFEADFVGFSYGFRPGRGPHDALDALAVAIDRRRVNWILDADIRGFFDTLDHGWLVKFVEHRIADSRVVRHIKKWLMAGVLENGTKIEATEGTPQGGSISPLLGNIYLHYVLDLWVASWRKRRARGEVIIVRYADDFAVGFEYRDDAERFWRELEARLRQFALELHPSKTRLLEFGRFAARNRQGRGEGKPETFDFLGLTHICGRTRKGNFALRRQTRAVKLRAKLLALKRDLRTRMHRPVPELGKWLASVLLGHYRYYGVPGNYHALRSFRSQVRRLWQRTLNRRSQKSRCTSARMYRLEARWLPHPRLYHPWPSQRLTVDRR